MLISVRRVGSIEVGPRYRWVDAYALIVDGREWQPWFPKRKAMRLKKELEMEELKPCGGCGVEPGKDHQLGCDVERCSRCGRQAISCNCVYIVNGMDPDTLEEKYPEIYNNGPTEKMVEKFLNEVGTLPWTGLWPGIVECREFGFWCLWGPDMNPPRQGWIQVPAGTPGATEHLNLLYMYCTWDRENKKWVKKELKVEQEKNMMARAVYGEDLKEANEAGTLLTVEDLENAMLRALEDLLVFGPLAGAQVAITTLHVKGDEWGVLALLRNQDSKQHTPIIVGPVRVSPTDVMVERVKAVFRPCVKKLGMRHKNMNLG